MNSEPINYDDFIDLPVEQWTDWMRGYLREHILSAEAFKTLIDVTRHTIDTDRTQAFLAACEVALTAAAQHPTAFDTYVLPLFEAHRWSWDTLSQLLVVAGGLDQHVCDALVAPLWSHPSSKDCFMVLNETARRGKSEQVHPLLNPKILSHPRVYNKYKLLPMCFMSSFNEQFFHTYGVEGLKYLKDLGLMTSTKYHSVLDHMLCADTPEFLKAWHSVEPIDFVFLQERCPMYLTDNNKALMFYQVFVELSDDPHTAQWVLDDLLLRKNERPSYTHPELDGFLKTLAQRVQWDAMYVGEILHRCHRNMERCLDLLMDLVPPEHASLIDAYFIEGGFEMTDTMKVRAQKFTLQVAVAPVSNLVGRHTRKM